MTGLDGMLSRMPEHAFRPREAVRSMVDKQLKKHSSDAAGFVLATTGLYFVGKAIRAKSPLYTNSTTTQEVEQIGKELMPKLQWIDAPSDEIERAAIIKYTIECAREFNYVAEREGRLFMTEEGTEVLRPVLAVEARNQ